MNDGAIDFRKLLREEKKKARMKQRQKESSSSSSSSQPKSKDLSCQPQKPNRNETKESLLPLNHIVREEDVEAIDFQRLVQQEQNKVAQHQREQALAESWSIPTVFDRHQHLLCSNPPTIYYLPDFLPNDHDQQSLMEWLQSLPENNNSTQSNNSANGAWTPLQYAKRRVALFEDITNNNDSDTATTTNPSTAPFSSSSPILQRLAQALVSHGIFPPSQPPNHLLINEYHPGQGILPHTDGPAYTSRTATLSLGSDVLIQFTPRPNYYNDDDETTNNNNNGQLQPQQQEVQILLEKGSLLVFEDSAYLDYCHGIVDRVLDEPMADHCMNRGSSTPGTMPSNQPSSEDTATTTARIVPRGYRISLTFRHKNHPETSS